MANRIRGNAMGAHLRTFIVMAGLAMLSCGAAQARNITSQDWGTTQAGEKVSLFTLKSGHGLEARITNYGGRIVSLYVPNK
jgi:aldose 1-epimerase